jgi:hypothetical protein
MVVNPLPVLKHSFCKTLIVGFLNLYMNQYPFFFPGYQLSAHILSIHQLYRSYTGTMEELVGRKNRGMKESERIFPDRKAKCCKRVQQNSHFTDRLKL